MPRLSRDEAHQQTREKLLASAKDVFAKRGFAGASVDEIAENAGYSKGAVYSNFDSKEALFLELLRGRMSEEVGQLHEMLKISPTIDEALAALQQRYGALETQQTWCLLSSEFQLQAGRDPHFGEAFAELYRTQRRAVARLVTMVAERAGMLLLCDAEEIATSLMALTHGIALQRAADSPSVRAGTAGKALRLFLTAAMSPAPGPHARKKSWKRGRD